MNSAELADALHLPASACVDRRVPKKHLMENGAPTAADKRRIGEGIDEVYWLAALKPTTIGVPAFRDATREYLEIAVLSASLRPDAQSTRLAELIHRAVPYPVVLLTAQGGGLALSFAHKRWSQGEAGVTVLDGTLVVADLGASHSAEVKQAFLRVLPITCQPRESLYGLYQGWIDTMLALLAAGMTGTFAMAGSREHAEVRRSALAECGRLDAQVASLRATAAKEKQISRQVELNLELKRLEAVRAAVRTKL